MQLEVQKREEIKKGLRRLRASGKIPAELYGHGIENIHLSVSKKEFGKIFKEAGEHTVINVKLGADSRPVLIQDVNEDPLTGQIRHVDFYQVKMDEKIKAMIPITFIGESQAVKEKSGVLVKALQELEVEALPGNLPHEIEVDISVLDSVGKSLYVSDIKLKGDVEIIIEPETVVASITDLAPEEIEEAPVSVEDVKVEGEEEVEARRKDKEAKAGEEKAENEKEQADKKEDKPQNKKP